MKISVPWNLVLELEALLRAQGIPGQLRCLQFLHLRIAGRFLQGSSSRPFNIKSVD